MINCTTCVLLLPAMVEFCAGLLENPMHVVVTVTQIPFLDKSIAMQRRFKSWSRRTSISEAGWRFYSNPAKINDVLECEAKLFIPVKNCIVRGSCTFWYLSASALLLVEFYGVIIMKTGWPFIYCHWDSQHRQGHIFLWNIWVHAHPIPKLCPKWLSCKDC